MYHTAVIYFNFKTNNIVAGCPRYALQFGEVIYCDAQKILNLNYHTGTAAIFLCNQGYRLQGGPCWARCNDPDWIPETSYCQKSNEIKFTHIH